jgi:hypothetical protein
MINELRAYTDVLRDDEQALFERLMKHPLQHVGAMTNASSMHVWAFMLISIIIEQEKRIEELEDVVDRRVSEQQLTRVLDERWH